MIERALAFVSRPWVRAVLAAFAALVAVVVAWPAPVEEEQSLSWDRLIRPLETGGVVYDGYRLSPPRRGEEHDVVFTARRAAQGGMPAAHVEVHVVNRGQWPGVPETASFGVAWEVPRSSAPDADLAAVNARILEAIDANDPGGLGPVDAIPLHSPSALPASSRVLGGLTGLRGWTVAGAVMIAVLLLGSLRWGTLSLAVVLGLLGLGVRLAHLGVPFVRDQDIQRVVTAGKPLWQILSSDWYRERRPPLFLAILHLVEWAGQDEWIVRLPAALFGALVAPALLWALAPLSSRATVAAAAGATVVALSPVLIEGSREVSDIPLFTVVLLMMTGCTARALTKPSRARSIGVCVTHALALWSYYIAPFAIAGELAILGILYWRARSGEDIRDRVGAVLRWAVYGIVAGSPAIVLAVITLFRDRGARATASLFPDLAWGQRTPLEMLSWVAQYFSDALGVAMLVLFAAGLAGLAIVRFRDRRAPERAGEPEHGSVVASLAAPMVVVVVLAIVALTPVARIQAYYAAPAVPLVVVAVAAAHGRLGRWIRPACGLAVVLSCTSYVATSFPAVGRAYVGDPSMPRHVRAAEASGAEQIVTLAHYDALLVAYYLARHHGRPLRADDTSDDGDAVCVGGVCTCVVPLVRSHEVDRDTPEHALAELRELTARRRTLILARDVFRLPGLEPILSRCRTLDIGTETTLLDCSELARGTDP